MRMKHIYCVNCGRRQPYRTYQRMINMVHEGVRFTCLEEQTYCAKCLEDVYIPEVNDRNKKHVEMGYRSAIEGNTENVL